MGRQMARRLGTGWGPIFIQHEAPWVRVATLLCHVDETHED